MATALLLSTVIAAVSATISPGGSFRPPDIHHTRVGSSNRERTAFVHFPNIAYNPDSRTKSKPPLDIIPDTQRDTSKLYSIIHVKTDVSYSDMKDGVCVEGGRKTVGVDDIHQRASAKLDPLPLGAIPNGLRNSGWEKYGYVALSIADFHTLTDPRENAGVQSASKFQDGWYDFIILNSDPDHIRMFKRDESASLSDHSLFDQTSMLSDKEMDTALTTVGVIKYLGQIGVSHLKLMMWTNEGTDLFKADSAFYKVIGKHLGLEDAYFKPNGRHCWIAPTSRDGAHLSLPLCSGDFETFQDASPLVDVSHHHVTHYNWRWIVLAVSIACCCSCVSGCAIGTIYTCVSVVANDKCYLNEV